jgi:N-acetylneuraminic acid mutarotase
LNDSQKIAIGKFKSKLIVKAIMKNVLSLVLIISAFYSNAQNWNQVANFSGDARDDASSFTINNHVYCGLGMNAGFSCTSDFKVFDLNTESWSNAVSLPTGEERQYANGFSYQDFGYIFGGINGSATYLSDFWKFNPVSNAWTSLPDLPTTGRSGALSLLIGDTVYIVGGKTNGGIISNEVWAFDLVQEQWFQKASLPFDGIWRGVSFSWNNAGVIGLGKLNSGNFNTGFYLYYPTTDTWQLLNQLTLAPTIYSMFSQIGKYGFIYGGALENLSYSNQFTRIDLETWATTSLTPFPAAARRGGVAFVNNSEFFIATGVSTQARLNETWKADYILGMDKEQSLGTVNLYPNPLNNQLVIQSDALIQRIEIYTISGQLITTQATNAKQIDVPIDLENGLYLLRLVGENGALTEQICVQH